MKITLNASVSDLPLVGPVYQKRLEHLGIKTIKDFLYHLPHKYLDFRHVVPTTAAAVGEIVTVKGVLLSLKNQYTRTGRRFQIGEIEDERGKLTVIWFNQPFLVRSLYPGTLLSLSGKVDWFGRTRALISPEYEKIEEGGETSHTGKLVPVYPETEGLSSKWLRRQIKTLFPEIIDDLCETLPETILKENHLLSLKESLFAIHFPQKPEEAREGKKRLAFEELLNLHLENLKRKAEWQNNAAATHLKISPQTVSDFVKLLTFKLTPSQKRTLSEITEDLQKAYPMNRLLEGDVGSGKTVVAAFAIFAAFKNGCQSVLMAPTQILAQQHFQTLSRLFDKTLKIALVTSETSLNDKKHYDLLVGTHALMHQKADFKNVALIVVDEIHRFGVEQKEQLAAKTKTTPHILTMTATPIPRTMALTFYGDLDLSTLSEIPGKRPRITTWLIPPEKRGGAYKWLETQLSSGSQVFVVCPLIEDSEAETLKDVKAVKAEYARLRKKFPHHNIGLLHGRLKGQEKEKILADFRNRKTALLVTTPVIEVGIDIPNATIMVIEGAERFGLAQLHQLRGRVGRGEKKSYCLLFASEKSGKIDTRLKALTENKSGFELAEIDLNLRGPGEIFGLRQHGLPDLKIASWHDTALIKRTKEVAQSLLLQGKGTLR